VSLATIDSEKIKRLLATHIDGEARLLSAIPLTDQISKSVLSNSAKYWIELSKTPDHVHPVVVNSGFVSTRSADDEVQDSQPSNRQQY
jgi:hypothetical protein